MKALDDIANQAAEYIYRAPFDFFETRAEKIIRAAIDKALEVVLTKQAKLLEELKGNSSGTRAGIPPSATGSDAGNGDCK